MGRMLAQAVPHRAEFLSKIGDKLPKAIRVLHAAKSPVRRASPMWLPNLLQSKVSYGRHTSLPRSTLQLSEGLCREGGDSTVRQDHTCNAGKVLCCQPLQPCQDYP